MQILKKQIAYNRKKRSGQIRYIVIHDTGNTKKGADAAAHFAYFNSGDRSSSADFFVDSNTVLQVNDYTVYYTWHVGDGKGKYGITNANSLGIEICVNQDGDYEQAVSNAVWLVKQLMTELGIPPERVVRHYDASRKNCPASMQKDNWKRWDAFLCSIKEEESMFLDIKGHYAQKHIKELHEMGVVNGVDKTHFAPDEPITRGQAAIMVRNAIRAVTGK